MAASNTFLTQSEMLFPSNFAALSIPSCSSGENLVRIVLDLAAPCGSFGRPILAAFEFFAFCATKIR